MEKPCEAPDGASLLHEDDSGRAVAGRTRPVELQHSRQVGCPIRGEPPGDPRVSTGMRFVFASAIAAAGLLAASSSTSAGVFTPPPWLKPAERQALRVHFGGTDPNVVRLLPAQGRGHLGLRARRGVPDVHRATGRNAGGPGDPRELRPHAARHERGNAVLRWAPGTDTSSLFPPLVPFDQPASHTPLLHDRSSLVHPAAGFGPVAVTSRCGRRPKQPDVGAALRLDYRLRRSRCGDWDPRACASPSRCHPLAGTPS